MNDNSFEFVEKLAEFPYITKYYGTSLNSLDKSHPIILNLTENYYLFEFPLDKINTMLAKLDSWADIHKIVRESKNPKQFFDALSELKVVGELIDRVSYIRKMSTPDFEIKIDNQVITLEVKRIGNKLGNPSDNENPVNDSRYAQFIDDIETIIRDAENSILERHQYREGTPHILIFDCSTLMGSIDFEDSLYLKSSEPEFIPKKHGNTEKKVRNERLFYQKDDEENFVYSNLSGVIGIFDFQSISMNPENNQVSVIKPHWVFYENPHSDNKIKIEENVLERLRLKKFIDENIKKVENSYPHLHFLPS